MSREQVATIKALDAMIEASTSARQSLRRKEIALRRLQRRIEKGTPVSEAFAGLEIPARRREMTEGLEFLEAASRRVRRATIALGATEGLSLGEMSRIWGLSRQLVTRLAKENR